MTILIFGAAGQVARCLIDEAGANAATALGRGDVDLAEPGAGAAAAEARKPSVIINAAAYTAVDKAEEERNAARRLNAEAPSELAEAAKALGVPYIHISTDYVFDGASDDSYAEDAATNPLNAYGATKLEGERAVMAAYPESIILRTSWVFSEYGGNFVNTMLRVGAERDTLAVVADQVGGPTPAREIARAILAIAGKKSRGAPGAGLYHFQGTPAVSWAGFARKIFEIAEMDATVNDIPTTDYPTPARRPLRTVLDCARIERDFGVAPPDWRGGLRQVVAALKTGQA